MSYARRVMTIGLAISFAVVSRPFIADAEEVPARGPIPFSAYDTNGDGAISEEEFDRQRMRMEERRRSGMKRGRGAGPGEESRRRTPSFEDFDLDGDGGFTEEEFQRARANRIADRAKQGLPMRNVGNAPPFGEIDSDGNGTVSREEFAEHQARHRESRSGAAPRDE